MSKHYMTKGTRAFEFVFDGNSIDRVTEIQPIERLGDLQQYDKWDINKKIKAKRFFEVYEKI